VVSTRAAWTEDWRRAKSSMTEWKCVGLDWVAVPNNGQCSSAQIVAVSWLSQSEDGVGESLQLRELQFGDEVSQHFLEGAHAHGP
jgi:hypothetical protein